MVFARTAERQHHVRSRRRRAAAIALILTSWLSLFAAPARAQGPGQKPLAPGTLPAESFTGSMLLGTDLKRFQQWWNKPISPIQASWKAAINAAADAKTDFPEVTNAQQSAQLASIAQARALRWALARKPDDFAAAVAILRTAVVVNPSELSRPEIVVNFLIAYDLLRDGELKPEDKQAIEPRLQTMADAIGQLRMHQQVNNLLAKRAATRAFAGLVLRNQTLLDSGLTDLSNSWNANTLDDGWYTDSPVYYLNYTLPHLIPFAVAYKNASGVDLAPRLARFFDMSLALRMPDGRAPNIGDGLNAPPALHLFTRLIDPARRSAALWHLASLPSYDWASSNLANNDRTCVDNFLFTDFTAAPLPPSISPTFISHSAGGSHVAVFRRDWTAGSDYLLLNPGIDGQRINGSIVHPGHGHNDTGEVVLFAKGQLIFTAPGYNRADLSKWPAKNFNPGNAINHNVVLIDGDMPDGASKRPETVANPVRLDSVERGAFKGACDFSLIEFSSSNASLQRAAAFPNEDYFVIADWLGSNGPRTYMHQLIGRGALTRLAGDTGTVLAAKWEVGKAQATATVLSGSYMSSVFDSTWSHDTLNVFDTTQRMRCSIRSPRGGYLTVIDTDAAGVSPRLKITNLSQADFSAAQVADAKAGWTDTIYSQPRWTDADNPAPLHTVSDLSTDAAFAYVRTTGAPVTSWFVGEGRQLIFNKLSLLKSTTPITASFTVDKSTLRATVSPEGLSDETRLSFPALGKIVSATLGDQPIPAEKLAAGVPVTGQGGLLVVEFAAAPSLAPKATTQPATQPATQPDPAKVEAKQP